MMFNATFNNISAVSWQSILLIGGGTGVPEQNHRSVACHWQTLSHTVDRVHFIMSGIRTHNCSGDCTNCS